MIIERYHLQTEVTGTEDGKHTYEIYREWNPDGKKAVIIELYPTISVLNAEELEYFSQVSAPEKGKKKKNRKRTRKTEEDRENVSENQKPA
jgi:hypothetical protein